MRDATTVWAKSQWRRRWVALVFAMFVLALSGSLALAAAQGARHANGAFDRLRDQTSASDIGVDVNDPSLRPEGDALVARLLPLIGATGAAKEDRYWMRPAGSELVPGFEIYALVQHQLLDRPVDVPAVIAGHLPDPTNSGQIALGRRFAELLGLHVGDQVTFESAPVDLSFSGPDADKLNGPKVEFTVTAIVVSPLDFDAPAGVAYLTPAFADTYATQIYGQSGVHIQVSDKARALEMVRSGTAESSDAQLDGALGVGPSPWSNSEQVSGGLRVVSTALWLFAGVVASAGLITFALLVRRLARSTSTDFEVLSAIGLDRRGKAVCGVLLIAPVVALGVAGAALGGIALTPFVRVGIAAQVDPESGPFVVWQVLTLGMLVLAISAFVVSVPSYILMRRTSPRSHVAVHHPAISRPIPISLGIRYTLGGKDGGGTSRATVFACVGLMTAVVASMCFGASMARLPTRPELWGGGSNVALDFGEGVGGEPNEPYDQALRALTRDPRLDALAGKIVFYPQVGGLEPSALALDTRLGEPMLTMLAGRAPSSPSEIVMGRVTMRRLSLHLGDVVNVTLGDSTESFHLVGQAAFPLLDFPVFGDGVAVTLDGGSRFPEFAAGAHQYQIMLKWADEVDEVAAMADLVGQRYHIGVPRPPAPVANLVQVQQLPLLLAAFFGVLALTTVAYLLAVSARARRRQFAVLAALGLRPGDRAAIVGWQAATLGVLACALGVPAGIVAGRAVWTAVVRRIGVAAEHELPLGALAVTVAIALFGSLSIAVVLILSARRQPLATSLRAD